MTATAPRLSSAEQKYIQELAARMKSMDEVQASLKMLLYGDSGVGKTITGMHIAQALTPPEKIIIYVDSAEGWVSLRNFPALKNRTQLMTLSKSSQMEDIANAIRAKAGIFGNVGAVVIDEHSSIADFDLLAVTKSRALLDTSKDADQPTQPDMGVTTNRIFKFTSQLILPDTHLILTAHMRVDKDNMGRTRTAPSYMPKLNSYIRGLVHVIGYMTADEVVKNGKVTYNRKVRVHPTSKIVAKTRIGGLPPETTTNELIKAAREWLGGTRDTQSADVLTKDTGEEVNRDILADEVTDTITSGEE